MPTSSPEFQVFLSHNSVDTALVVKLKSLLRERGLHAWLDRDELRPGEPWQPRLEQGLAASAVIVACIGLSGRGPWQSEEMKLALWHARETGKRILPVLLPSAPQDVEIPGFLDVRLRVDLRDGFTAEGLDALEWGITGRKPGSRAARGHNLPRLPWFFGRNAELDIVAHALEPDVRSWGALIEGPAGMGKTSLAVRAAELAADRFDRVVFVTAKSSELRPEGERPVERFVSPSYGAMLRELGAELGIGDDVERSPEGERPELLHRALRRHPALVIFDNLESLSEADRTAVYGFLDRLPPGSKAIVTSRQRTDVSAKTLRLERLEPATAEALVGALAEDRPALRRATADERAQLIAETGGNPLLLRWVAGQLGRGRFHTIVSALALLRAAPADNDPLEFIFGDLAREFTPAEAKVLGALTHLTGPADLRQVAELAGLNRALTQSALDDLAYRALVNADAESRHFVLAPLVGAWLRRARPDVVREPGNRPALPAGAPMSARLVARLTLGVRRLTWEAGTERGEAPGPLLHAVPARLVALLRRAAKRKGARPPLVVLEMEERWLHEAMVALVEAIEAAVPGVVVVVDRAVPEGLIGPVRAPMAVGGDVEAFAFLNWVRVVDEGEACDVWFGVPTTQVRTQVLVLPTAEPWPSTPADAGAVIVPREGRLGGDHVRELLFALVHDQPLEQAVAALGVPVLLYAPPALLDAIRIRHRATRTADAALWEVIAGTDGPPRRPDGFLAQLAALPFRFEHEGWGMEPIIALSRSFGRGFQHRGETQRELAPRTVDLRIQRLEESPLTQERPLPEAVWVPADTTLRAGARYALRVQIGRPVPGNLVAEPGDFDAHLPPWGDEASRLLEVVVFGQDFGVEGPSREKIEIARTGASSVARFTVIPPRGRPRANLRVCIYFAGALVQAFRMRARVGREEAQVRGRALVAARDFDAAPGLLDFEGPRRRFTLAVNQSGGGDHDVMVRTDDVVAARRVSVRHVASFEKSYRALIDAVGRDSGGARYPARAGGPDPFPADLARLARLGWELEQSLFHGTPELQDAMTLLREGADETVQVVRLDGNLALPWALVYDFDRPRPGAAVCPGERSGVACDHTTHGDDVVCLRGFWGVRHRLEELVNARARWPDRIGGADVVVAVDNSSPRWTDLGAHLLPGTRCLPDGVDLLDPLVPAQGRPRPGVLVLFAHKEIPDGGTDADALLQVAPDRELSLARLSKYCRKRWADDPRTAVLLLACSTAFPERGYVSFVSTLCTLGPGAIVATEAPVTREWVVGWARAFLARFPKEPLADAVRGARIDLLRAGNPLGFAFSVLGAAELTA